MRNRTIPLIYKIFKPKGASSFSVIASLKKEFPKSKDLKIGHFGTLDPFAEGLLLVGVYGATRLNQYLQKEFSKTYEARGILGQKTTTGDLEGTVLEELSCENLKEYSLLDLKQILEEKFKGNYLQSPPSYSAAKHNGKSLYKYAQSGQIIIKEPVLRFIHHLEILSFDFPYINFRATVGSGTYIRSLFEDMANTLGTVGHLKELKRTSIGDQQLIGSIIPETFGINKERGMRLDEVYSLAQVYLTDDEERKFCCGNNVRPDKMGLNLGDFLWVYNQANTLMGMGQVKDAGLFPVWVFAQNAVS